jgi:hypothetical protein
MHLRPLPLAALGLALAAGGLPADEPAPNYGRRWVFCMHNLLVPQQAEAVVGIIERAGRAGYNGVVLTDYKFNILDRMPPNYFQNVERVKQAAAKAGLEIIPSIFPVGYSDGLLVHDPNLAEGLPVTDAPFVVRGREAVLAPDPPARLVNGGLEEAKGDRFAGFSFQDDPGVVSFADRVTAHGGAAACRFQDFRKGSSGNARLVQCVAVRPHACYRLSAWVKTRDLAPAGVRLAVIGKSGRSLTFHEPHQKPTQDWTQLEVAFNCLGETEVNVYAGLWGGRSGTFWVDDLALEEQGLVNVLRRDGCPLVVRSADGQTVYEEGKDFLPVRDSRLGNDPHAGSYAFRHAGPPIGLTPTSRIRDGDRLRVSWYHPVVVHGEQVMCCLTEPKVYDLLSDQARRVNDLFHPRTFFLSHDEIRVAGWCKSCEAAGQTPGALLADNVRRCVGIVKEVNPAAEIVIWSDMFDPHHNAIDKYYLVNGSLKGSWEGLPKDVIVANWNSGKAAESLKWFAGRGHRQILAGYYDAGPETFGRWDAAARGVQNVVGFLYTTWQAKYADLEAYSRAMLGGR